MKIPLDALSSVPVRRIYAVVKRLAGISVPVALVVVAALALYPDAGPVMDSPALLFVMNLVFIVAVSFVVAYIVARAYLESGIIRLVLLGTGALLFGLNSFIGGLALNLPNAQNVAITVHNTAALAAGLFHLSVAVLFAGRLVRGGGETHRLWGVALFYGAAIVFTGLLVFGASNQYLPHFIIPGSGFTPLRQLVLGAAILAFATSGVLLFLFYLRTRIQFHYWYALALLMTGIGLAGIFFQTVSGSLLNWMGRLAQQGGGAYLGLAVLTILREGQLRGIALEMRVAAFFRDAEANYQALVETALDAIISIDRKARIILWNSGARRIFGYTRDEALVLSLADLIPGAEPFSPTGPLQETLARRKNGETFPIEYTISMRRAAGGSISTLVLRDITGRKQAEAKIAELNRVLEQRARDLELANKELESFSYSVSHDLRAPLSSIGNFAQVLLDDHATAIPDEAHTYLELIRDNSAAMMQLIEGLLHFSRSVRQPVQKQTVDVSALVQQAFGELVVQREGREVELVVGDLPPAEADPLLLKQVFLNLLSNACKFTRTREVARIEVGVLPARSKMPTALASGTPARSVVYYVRDNGVGFPNEQAEKLFGVFQRLHSEDEYEGTGVGLAIVERIIHRHGGRVCAEGEPDVGAVFYFTLG